MMDWQGVIESGSWDRVLNSYDVTILAHYSPVAQVSRSVEALIEAFRLAGFTTVLVSTGSAPEPLRFRGEPPELVVRRPNFGYDFGSWAWAINGVPELVERRVLLFNDSLVGPFADAVPLFQGFRSSPAQVWGITGSSERLADQSRFTVQSYCVGYSPGTLGNPAIHRYWANIIHYPSKEDVINICELGQSAVFADEGLSVELVVPLDSIIYRGQNPTLFAWRGLLNAGVPFVKRVLLGGGEAGAVAAELAGRFGVEVGEWL